MSLTQLLLLSLLPLALILGQPGFILIALLGLFADWLSRLWSNRGLDRLDYERRLNHERAVWGDEIELTISAANNKLLPLPWVRTDDHATTGLNVRETPLLASDRPGLGLLRNSWTLMPYQRITRRLHVLADKRGVFHFGPVQRSVADLFGQGGASDEREMYASFVVRPRTVPLATEGRPLMMFGTRSARMQLLEDPFLFAGVRPFQRGDSRRRIHARASARVGQPVSKRYDPSTARQQLIVVDIQTVPGEHWLLQFEANLVESLIVAAASIARQELLDGAEVGLAVNAWSNSLNRSVWILPRAGAAHLNTILDTLARVSQTPSLPFEHLLGTLPTRIPHAARLLTLSTRDPAGYLPLLRRLSSLGYEVGHIALGPQALEWSRRLSAMGVDTRLGRLEPDWRSSPQLVLG